MTPEQTLEIIADFMRVETMMVNKEMKSLNVETIKSDLWKPGQPEEKMQEYYFAAGYGHLSPRVARAARKSGGDLVNFQEAGCYCGLGCSRKCPAGQRHWFVVPNNGQYQSDILAHKVMTSVRAAATKKDLRYL